MMKRRWYQQAVGSLSMVLLVGTLLPAGQVYAHEADAEVPVVAEVVAVEPEVSVAESVEETVTVPESEVVTESGTVYLAGETTKQTFTIRFYGNGGDGVMTEIPATIQTPVTLPQNTFTRPGYNNVKRWNTSADGTGTSYAEQGTLSIFSVNNLVQEGDAYYLNLYAQWRPVSYTVELNLNYKNAPVYPMYCRYDEEMTLTDVSSARPGYRITHWSVQPDGSGNSYQDRQTIKNLTVEDNGKVTLYAQWESIFENPEGIQVYYRTQDQIRSFANKHPVKNLGASYAVQPNLSAPYGAGRLTDAVQQDALNVVNIIRYSAGLSADVQIKQEYVEKAQAGALVNAVNRQLSHYPSKPSGMSDALYQTGYQGASSSNIAAAWGFSPSLASRVYDAWMADDDSSNIDRVGHRRWVLNPEMKYTGFGQVGGYYQMYALDHSGTSNGEVALWPAQNTLLEYFKPEYPWSYSSGEYEDMAAVKVRLTKIGTNQVWNFSNSSSNGYFNVSNGGYGLSGCVIFRPNNISINSQDEFRVSITGLTDGDVSYTVRFFGLNDGWKKVNGKWVYRVGNGYVTNNWKKVDGTWYYFDGNGYMQTGWVKVGSTWYYMSASGAMQTGWVKVSGKWYYLKASGAMATGWVKVGNTWYYMNGSGAMVTGWARVNGKWYYMSGSGAMQTGWVKTGGKWYYMNASGAMVTGWARVNGKWYYMEASGAMKTGWLKEGQTWYYLEGSGAMLADTSRQIGNKVYHFSASGRCTNP